MRWIKMIPLLLASPFAYAEVNVIEDSNKTNQIHYVRVVNKEPIHNVVMDYLKRYVCVANAVGNIKCEEVYRRVPKHILIGYHVTYEFRGKLIRTFIEYDPGTHVQVYVGE